jgi:hypothetical protein
MPSSLVTKNDFLVLAAIILIALGIWGIGEYSDRSKSPFNGCRTSEMMIEVSSDRKVVTIDTLDGNIITSPVIHRYFSGSGACETATYLFTLNSQLLGLSNLGCHPINAYPEKAKGLIYKGQWENSNPQSFDWTDELVEPPKEQETCF